MATTYAEEMSTSSKGDEATRITMMESKDADPTCRTFMIEGEDHTLGNALKHIMSHYSEVEMCGYNTPHPLEDKILIRVQTKEGHRAVDLLRRALNDLDTVFGHIRETCATAMTEHRQT